MPSSGLCRHYILVVHRQTGRKNIHIHKMKISTPPPKRKEVRKKTRTQRGSQARGHVPAVSAQTWGVEAVGTLLHRKFDAILGYMRPSL